MLCVPSGQGLLQLVRVDASTGQNACRGRVATGIGVRLQQEQYLCQVAGDVHPNFKHGVLGVQDAS